MFALARVRYVNTGDDSIAYRDFGGSGVPLVYMGTNGSHQDLMWDEPGYSHFLRSLAGFGRLITFDRRGTGLSSRTVTPTVETRVADIDRVLDATAIEHAVLVAAGGSTEAALAFAAMRPDRTRALVLYAPVARISATAGYEIGAPASRMQESIIGTEAVWGTGITADLYAPSLASDREFRRWAARHERAIATPVEARQMVEMYLESDIRDVLPVVRAPALVAVPTLAAEFGALSRYVADHLSDVRRLDLPTRDQWPFGEAMEQFLEATATFLRDTAGLEASSPSRRRLAAVLFTDIVGSTDRLSSLGDQRWDTTLDSHDEAARRAVGRHHGRIVKSTGDGILAVFDGPASAVAAAVEILRSVRRIGLSARAGVHVGELVERGDDVSGIAVTLCSRIADHAAENEVLTSSTVRDLVAGSGLTFETRGSHRLKGIDEPVTLLAVNAP